MRLRYLFKKRASRRGYAILEALAAMALLSAATVGLVKIAQVHSLIRQRDDVRLSAKLAATNLLESFHGKSVREIQETLERTETNLPNLEIRVDQEPIDGESVTGIHIIVSVHDQHALRQTKEPLVREHFWVLNQTASPSDAEALP